MKEKALIEASLHMLKQEKEATAASKEAAIFKEAALEFKERGSLSELQDLALEDPIKHTKDYIETQPFEKHAAQDSIPQMPDLAQYLMRKEMVSSGLLAFDDRPENY